MGPAVDENNLDHFLWDSKKFQQFNAGHFFLDINLLRIAPASFPKQTDKVHKGTEFDSRRHVRFLQLGSRIADGVSISVSLRHFRDTFKLSAVDAVRKWAGSFWNNAGKVRRVKTRVAITRRLRRETG